MIDEGLAGLIGGMLLEYATKKKLNKWKVFFYTFTVFSLLFLILVYFFPEYPVEHSFLYGLSVSTGFGTLCGSMMVIAYHFSIRKYQKMNKEKI